MSLTLEEKQNQMHTKEILGLHCDCEAGETLWLEFPESSPHRTTPFNDVHSNEKDVHWKNLSQRKLFSYYHILLLQNLSSI